VYNEPKKVHKLNKNQSDSNEFEEQIKRRNDEIDKRILMMKNDSNVLTPIRFEKKKYQKPSKRNLILLLHLLLTYVTFNVC
jgi:hypothetical protein